MATATLSRGSTTVEITLLEEGGTPLVSRDIGKPTLKIHETGSLDPRHNDQWAGVMSYNILGRLVTDDAYAQAIQLCDLLKSHSSGTETILNIDMPEYDTDVTVVPSAGQKEALNVAYSPGRRNWVDVDLGLTRVGTFQSGDVGDSQMASTPTADGSGPIELSFGGSTVSLTTDVSVSRSVGRHNSDIEGQVPSKYPLYQEKQKTAYDGFSIELEVVDDTVSKVNALVDMFTTRLGRNSLTLDFNGLYGMGEFPVVPDGGNALRHQRVAGQQGTARIPTVNLRRVLD